MVNALIIILVACVVLLPCTACHSEDIYQTVAEINNIPVALGELQMFMDDARPKALARFREQHGLASVGENDWHKEIDGESPADVAVELALAEIAPYKIVQYACQERGILADISYRCFVEAWEKENQDRIAKKDAGEVVYGPVEYTQKVYYEYLRNGYINDLRKSMTAAPTDAELREIYDGNPDLFHAFGRITMQCILLPQADFSREQAEKKCAAFEKALGTAENAEKAAERAGLSDYYREQVFTASDMSTSLVQGYPEVEDAVESLREGQSQIIDDQGLQWLYFYCSGREGEGRKSFEDCRDELESLYQEQYFDRWLEEAAENADISFDRAIIQLLF